MNRIFKDTISVLVAGLMFTACSPEEFTGANPNDIPVIGDRTITVETDQETNTATFSISGDFQGCYPMWYLDGNPYSILPKASYSNVNRGTHNLKVYIMNRNGVSQASLSGSFTFNTSKIDFSPYFNRLCDKEWRIDYAEAGHMGCGEPGTDGSNWWSAAPEDKKDWGVYDDRIKFVHTETDEATGGSYIYNPGEGGTVYVNTGCTVFSTFNTHDGADFMATVTEQETTFTLIPGTFNDDDCVYIQFPANTLLPYIANDDIYENPLYRIEALTNNRLVLISDNGSIAWRMVFTSKSEVKGFEGFDANSAFNMWKGITPAMSFYYNPDPSWGNEQTAAFEAGFVNGNNDYSIAIPNKCYAQWQAQVHFHTNLTTSKSKNYDFSVILNSDKDQEGVTVKVTNEADNVAIINERIDLKKGEDFVFWKSDIACKEDMTDVKVVFDFGGADDNTTVSIRNIVLKDHADDDGTVLPVDDSEKPTMDWDVTSASNMWKSVEDGTALEQYSYYFANTDSWTPIEYNEVTHNNGEYTLVLPHGNGAIQWQSQFHIDTRLTGSASKSYNFYLVIEADTDCPNVTFKLTDSGDDNYLFMERNNLSADEPFILKKTGLTFKDGNDASAIRMFFDFGGSPENTTVKISQIYFEEVQ